MLSSDIVFHTHKPTSCPYHQRVVLALRAKDLVFNEILEDDVYDKSTKFAALNPRGLVPLLIDDGTAVWDSKIIVEYLADRYQDKGAPLLPPTASQRAKARMAVDFAFKKLELPFYSLMMSHGDEADQKLAEYQLNLKNFAHEFMENISNGSSAYIFGDYLSIADIAFIPYALRLEILLKGYFGCTLPQGEPWVKTFNTWLASVRKHEHVEVPEDEEMLRSYERYRKRQVKGQIVDALNGMKASLP